MRFAIVAVAAACAVLATAGTAPAAAPPFKATLAASSRTAKVGRPWYYMVRVTDARGRPVAASILPMVMHKGRRLDTVGSMLIWGACGRQYHWRRLHAGRRFTFRVQVQARGRVVNVDYALRVTR